MRKLTLHSGQELDVKSCGVGGGALSITLPAPRTVLEAATIFSNANETNSMTCYYGGDVTQTFENYTNLVYVLTDEFSGDVIVGLKMV